MSREDSTWRHSELSGFPLPSGYKGKKEKETAAAMFSLPKTSGTRTHPLPNLEKYVQDHKKLSFLFFPMWRTLGVVLFFCFFRKNWKVLTPIGFGRSVQGATSWSGSETNGYCAEQSFRCKMSSSTSKSKFNTSKSTPETVLDKM